MADGGSRAGTQKQQTACLAGEAVLVRVVFRIGVRGGFWMDVMAGYWGAVTAGEGLNAGLRKTRIPVFRRMKRTTSYTPIVKWSPGAV